MVKYPMAGIPHNDTLVFRTERTRMALTTNNNAALIARFDMLFSPTMKRYVKENGGAEFIRRLVLKHIMEQLRNTADSISDADKQRIAAMYRAELSRMNEDGRVA